MGQESLRAQRTAQHHLAHFAELLPASRHLLCILRIIAGPGADLLCVAVEQNRIGQTIRDMRPGIGAAHRRAALVGFGIDRREGGRTRHRSKRRRQVGRGPEKLVIVDAISRRDPRHGIALTNIILDRRIQKNVGHRAAWRDGVQEQVEAVSAGAELDLGIWIERVVVDRLDHGPLDHVGGAGDENEEDGNAADRLIGVAHPIVDMDRAGRGDEPDEQPDTDQDLETEGDQAHASAAHAREDRAEPDPDRRDDHHQRLVARVAEDHRHHAKGVDRLGEAVIGVEARIDRQCGRGEEQGWKGGKKPCKRTHGVRSYWLRAAAPAASRASRSRSRRSPA